MQAIPGEIKALVIFISNEMPDESTYQNTIQPVHWQAVFQCSIQFNLWIKAGFTDQSMFDQSCKYFDTWINVR